MTAAAARPWLVVLNWHGREDTLALLDTLQHEPVEVVVVDNGSFDGTLEAVATAFPAAATVQTGRNLGYAGGNNIGIAYAMSHGAGVVAVLNNDTLVTPGFFEPLLAALDERAPCAVSPDIRYADEPDVSWFRGSRIDRTEAWPVHLSAAEQPPRLGPPVGSQLLTGCCIAARADTWRRVGLFDDGLFLMFEDSDWSMRAIAAGVELLVVPRSVVLHRVSRSFTGSAGALGSYYYARNGLVFAFRHLGPAAGLRFVVRRVLRPLPARLRRSGGRQEAAMSVLGLLAALTRHRGRAGRVATRAASWWSRKTRAT